MTKKNLLKIIVGATTILIPTTSIISCNFIKDKYVSTDISGLVNEFGKHDTKLSDAAKEIKEGTNEKAKSVLNQKTILITTGGKVNDNSFNQSVWEAVSKFSKEIGLKDNSFIEVLKLGHQSSSDSAYTKALRDGNKIWILTGFQQEQLLINWLKIGNNRKRFIDEKIKIITVDWFSNDPIIPQGQVIGLNFRTQESSFVIGYALSRFFGTYFPNDESKRLLNTFAGGDFSGATNFNYGFYDGMRQWNEDIKANLKQGQKIKSTKINDNQFVTLDTGFGITQDAVDKVKANIEKEPKVTLPVAGSLTGVALDLIVERKTNQWVIGVDTDMSLSYSSQKSYLATSSEKKIGVAIYKALIEVYGLSKGYGLNDFLGKDYEIENELIILKNGNDNSSTLSNVNVIGGYADGFVGTSKSTIIDNEIEKALKNVLVDASRNKITLAQKIDQIILETWDEFFGKDKISGRFEKLKNNNDGLKPTEDVIKTGDAFEIRNVKYGQMTFGNYDNYFKPAIEEINKG